MIANDPHNRKPPLLLGFIAMVSGILLALFVISKVKAASDPQYIFYVNGTLYGTNLQRDIWVYPAGILDNSNVVYSYGSANAVQTVYTKINGNWQESEAPVHLQSTMNFTMVKGTFSYTNYEPEYVDEHFIPLTFDTAYNPKTLVAPCTECSASDPFYNVIYFQDHNSFRWYCYAHNGEIRFCNDNVILVQPSGALWYWETQDDQGDRWVLLDTSHVAVQGTDYLVYRAMWVVYARGNNLVAVTDYSSATVPSWPPTHGGGHSFNDGYITPISSFGYDDTCTIDYLQCVFEDPVEEEPSPTPSQGLTNYETVILQHGNNSYIMIDVLGSGVSSCIATASYSTQLQELQAEFNSTDDQIVYSCFIDVPKSNYGRRGYLYFNYETLSSINCYYLSALPVDLGYVRDNNTAYSVNIQELNSFPYSLSRHQLGYYYIDAGISRDHPNQCCIRFEYAYAGDNSYSVSSVYGNFNNIVIGESSDGGNGIFGNSSGQYADAQFKVSLKLRIDFEPVNQPFVTPTPEATATPTPPPYVIIITPDPSPTPTPPFVIPTMPPWNPPGNQIVPLNPETQDNVFGVFKNKIGDNNAFGLFGLLIGLLPGDLMWYLWFLLFILLVVGVAKLIIHFTGG